MSSSMYNLRSNGLQQLLDDSLERELALRKELDQGRKRELALREELDQARGELRTTRP